MSLQAEQLFDTNGLVVVITGGGRAKHIIMPASHLFLSDRAYARRAEKAGDHLASVYGGCENRFERTTECYCA